MKKNHIILGTTMRKYILVFVASMMAMTAIAQTELTPQQEREFYKKAYAVINTYANSKDFGENEVKTKFQTLFEKRDQAISNDLMGLSNKEELSVPEYIGLLSDADMVNVEISNVQKVSRPFINDNDEWELRLSFNKNISFVSSCNTYFNAREFYDSDYKMLMVLTMSPSTGECLIRELHFDPAPSPFPFPQDYRVLEKTDERDNNLDINGVFVKFSERQKILRSTDRLSYRGAKVVEKVISEGCDKHVRAEYGDKLWRVRLGGAFALSGFNKLGNSNGFTTSGDGETAFGVEFGYVFPSTKHLRFGVFAGVGMSMNKLSMTYMPTGKDLEFEAPGTADEDGDPYTRMYEMVGGEGITQDMKATDIAVPLYLDMEYEFNSKISIYADLGLKLQTSAGTFDTSTSRYKTWGHYTGYGQPLDIGKNDNVVLNDFGVHDAIATDDTGNTKSMAIDGLLGLGLRYNINKSFAVDAGVQYQTGGKSWTSDGGSIFSYTLEGGDAVNLLRKGGDISHSALKLSASVIYKF